MIMVMAVVAGQVVTSRGVEEYIVNYVKAYGHITSLDQWAHECGISPWYARQCAHAAERKRLVKLTRLCDIPGRPYKVTLLEERP
jgi:hypothetical protein